MAEEVPTLPFFFRIFSPNGQGIVYRADRDNGDSFMCTGSRQIGQEGSSIIWEVGGYADAMPRESMHSIMGKPKPMSKSETTAFVTRNRLGSKYNSMSLYTDGMGYWFAEKSRSRSRSGSNSNTNKSRTKTGRSKSRGRSTKNGGQSAARGRSASRGRASKGHAASKAKK
jgi:hypothetical protein